MYLLGHVGSAVVLWFVYEKYTKTRNDLHKFLFALGALLPDLLDKPIGSLFFNSGRWIGHDLLFQLLVLLILLSIDKYRLSSKFTKEIVILYFGSVLHVIGDCQSITVQTLLWPFFGPFPVGAKNSFLFGFTHQITILQEIIGFMLIVLVGMYEKWQRKYWILFFLIVAGYLLLFLIVYSLLVGW